MNVKRASVVLLAAVMMAGGVAACTPAGNQGGSGSAAAGERTVWPVDYRDVRGLLSKAAFGGKSVATAEGEDIDVLRDGGKILVTEKSDDPAAAADHAAKRAAALMAAISRAEKGVGEKDATQSATYAVANADGKYLAAVTVAKGADAVKLARDGKKAEDGSKADTTLADALNASTGWALVEDAATAAGTPTAGGSLVTDFGKTKVEVDTSTPKADAEKAKAEQEAQAAAAAQAAAQQQAQAQQQRQQSSGGNGGKQGSRPQSSPSQPNNYTQSNTGVQHQHSLKPVYATEHVGTGEKKWMEIIDRDGNPTGQWHWAYTEGRDVQKLQYYVCTTCGDIVQP